MDSDTETASERDSSPEPPKTRIKNNQKNSIVKCTAELIKDNHQQARNLPVAGYYPSGFGYTEISEQSNDSVTTYRNEKKSKRVELVVKPKLNVSKVDYVGTNYSGESAAGKIGCFGMLVLDKGSRKCDFVHLTSSRVFRLEPKVKRADTSDKEPGSPSNAELTPAERLEQLNSLTALYGTSGALKQAKKAHRQRQKEAPEGKQDLNLLLEETPVDKDATESTTLGANLNIPPHNLAATTPERAYPLEKIILKGEWDYLRDIVELAQAGEEIKPDVYPSFVCNRSHKVELVQDETEKQTVAGILSYITHLVNFKNKHSLDGVSSAKNFRIPSMLFQKFSKMFVDASKNRLADDKIGVLISYVLVLTLHVDEFESDFTDIARDLKVTAVSLRPYLENLGCKFKRRNNVTVATLPVPLVFPTVRKRRRRG